jgi:hypothetical protein
MPRRSKAELDSNVVTLPQYQRSEPPAVRNPRRQPRELQVNLNILNRFESHHA